MEQAIAHDMARTGLDAPFWEGLERGEFTMPRCATCQRWMWPADCRCPECGGYELEWPAVPAEGTVFTWTRTWYPFVPERAGALPYVVVLVELPHAGSSRMLGVLTGPEDGLRRDARVVGTIAPPSDATFGLPSVTWRLVDP
jgi:uncharacterized OB-fold protein